jgi:hypothetical protein
VVHHSAPVPVAHYRVPVPLAVAVRRASSLKKPMSAVKRDCSTSIKGRLPSVWLTVAWAKPLVPGGLITGQVAVPVPTIRPVVVVHRVVSMVPLVDPVVQIIHRDQIPQPIVLVPPIVTVAVAILTVVAVVAVVAIPAARLPRNSAAAAIKRTGILPFRATAKMATVPIARRS